MRQRTSHYCDTPVLGRIPHHCDTPVGEDTRFAVRGIRRRDTAPLALGEGVMHFARIAEQARSAWHTVPQLASRYEITGGTPAETLTSTSRHLETTSRNSEVVTLTAGRSKKDGNKHIPPAVAIAMMQKRLPRSEKELRVSHRQTNKNVWLGIRSPSLHHAKKYRRDPC